MGPPALGSQTKAVTPFFFLSFGLSSLDGWTLPQGGFGGFVGSVSFFFRKHEVRNKRKGNRVEDYRSYGITIAGAMEEVKMGYAYKLADYFRIKEPGEYPWPWSGDKKRTIFLDESDVLTKGEDGWTKHTGLMCIRIELTVDQVVKIDREITLRVN